jgi:AcrR family transcriptional regulator
MLLSMPSSASDTIERILHRGLDLLSEVGLSGVTLGLLAQEVDMSKSGLFAHFRSKDDVQIALLCHMADVANTKVVLPAMQVSPGLPRLKALVKNWFGWTTRAGLRGGCPVAAAMFELDDAKGEVRAKAVEMEAHWRGLLTQFVKESVERGHLRHDLDVDQFVWELCGIYLSHHTSSRFLRDLRSDARARKAFEALVHHARPMPKKTNRFLRGS